eukprot:3977997-Lingulodinium_polyedra.AAC.1
MVSCDSASPFVHSRATCNSITDPTRLHQHRAQCCRGRHVYMPRTASGRFKTPCVRATANRTPLLELCKNLGLALL